MVYTCRATVQIFDLLWSRGWLAEQGGWRRHWPSTMDELSSYRYWGTVGICNLHSLPAMPSKNIEIGHLLCVHVWHVHHISQKRICHEQKSNKVDTLLRMSTWLCHLASQQCSSTKLSTDSPHRPVDLWLSPGPLRLVFNSMAEQHNVHSWFVNRHPSQSKVGPNGWSKRCYSCCFQTVISAFVPSWPQDWDRLIGTTRMQPCWW